MKVYIVTEESIHEERDETDADCKRIVGVYEKLTDAQRAMRNEASRIPVVPGIDDTEAFSQYVETVKCRLEGRRDPSGKVFSDPTTDVTWRWSVDEYDVLDSYKAIKQNEGETKDA